MLAFAESSFFPVPPDVLLLALSVGAPKRAFRFALICAAGSVLGGMLGYWIGFGLWQSVKDFFIPYVFSQGAFDKVQMLYQGNAFAAILSAAFTPIPYKVFTIASFAYLVPGQLLLAEARRSRHDGSAVWGAIFLFGARVKTLIERYFDWLAWGLLALGIAGFVAVKYL